MAEMDSGALWEGLTTRCLGRRLVHLPIVGSTNDVAKELAARGEPEGVVVLAEEQTAGRGRRGRSWFALPGRCLLMSVVLRPPWPSVRAFSLVMLASVATASAIETVTGLACQIKWPNDLMVAGKKVGGILVEASTMGSMLEFVVVGIGVNVNLEVAALPPIALTATSLSHQLAREVSRVRLLHQLLEEMERRYFGLLKADDGSLYKEWRPRLISLGQEVSITGGGPLHLGREKGN